MKAAQLRFAAFICKLSALDLLGFQPVLGRPKKSPPSLCEQSELQCFASDLRRMFAQRLLLLCRHLLFGSKTRRQYHTAISLHEYYK